MEKTNRIFLGQQIIEHDAVLEPCRSHVRTHRPDRDHGKLALDADRLRQRVNGGESLLDYKARVLPFLDRLRHRPWQQVLLVAHEETLRVLQAWHRGLPDQALEGLHFANCELLELVLDPDSLNRPRL